LDVTRGMGFLDDRPFFLGVRYDLFQYISLQIIEKKSIDNLKWSKAVYLTKTNPNVSETVLNSLKRPKDPIVMQTYIHIAYFTGAPL